MFKRIVHCLDNRLIDIRIVRGKARTRLLGFAHSMAHPHLELHCTRRKRVHCLATFRTAGTTGLCASHCHNPNFSSLALSLQLLVWRWKVFVFERKPVCAYWQSSRRPWRQSVWLPTRLPLYAAHGQTARILPRQLTYWGGLTKVHQTEGTETVMHCVQSLGLIHSS
jgi:hypothetical protein